MGLSQKHFSEFVIFGCSGPSSGHMGFLQLRQMVSSWNKWASRCSGFFCCRAQALGMQSLVVVTLRLSSCGTGPICSVVRGVFLDQGVNLCPLHWQADSQPLDHQGSPTQKNFLTLGRILTCLVIFQIELHIKQAR